MGFEVQEGRTTVLCFSSVCNRLGRAENICLSEKHLFNGLFWQEVLMEGYPFGFWLSHSKKQPCMSKFLNVAGIKRHYMLPLL